jgi:ribosomal protein S18 acetylase RimI-like enzyme
MNLVRVAHQSAVQDRAFRRLLGLAVFNPTDDRITRLLAEFYQHPDRRLFGLYQSDTLVGVTGIERLAPGRATLLHIAVDPLHQRQGAGRHMLEQVAAQEALTYLTAETDHEAVEFYRRAGFSVASLGEQYPGVERFQCLWEVAGSE